MFLGINFRLNPKFVCKGKKNNDKPEAVLECEEKLITFFLNFLNKIIINLNLF